MGSFFPEVLPFTNYVSIDRSHASDNSSPMSISIVEFAVAVFASLSALDDDVTW